MENCMEKKFTLTDRQLNMFKDKSLAELEYLYSKTFGKVIEIEPFEMDDTTYIEKLMLSITDGKDYFKDIAVLQVVS